MKQKSHQNKNIFAAACLALLGVSTSFATNYTWDGTNNAPWSDAKWSDGITPGINWVNGGGNDAVVNSGDVYADIGISANSLTIGDGVGDAGSASARFATNNAFWFINTITINSDGILAGSANCTSHLLTVNLNGGTIGGGDNGGDAAFYGVIALHGPVNVNGGAVTSTISTTGGGILLVGPTVGAPTEFNVTDGAAAVDLLVSGNLVHRPFGDAEKLLKTGDGTMVLSGTNNYVGGTTVNAGTFSIQGNYNTMPSDGSVTINGGVLEVVQTLGGGPFDYNWYWGVDATEIKTGGTLTINSHSHIRNLTLSGGELASTGVDPINGYGGWVLDDSTTVNGGVTSTISAQQVSANDGGFVVEVGSTLNVTGTISAGNITKSGAGMMTLSGANTYTGPTTINEGTLSLQNTYATSGFSIASGAVLELNVASGTRDHASATFSGTGTLRKTGGGTALWGAGAATFTLGAGSLIDVQEGLFAVGSYANENMSGSLADLNVAAGATFDSAACDAYVNALTGAGTVVLAYTNDHARTMTFGVNNGGGTFSGTIIDGYYGGNGNLVKTGTGTQTLSGTNTYTGTTTVNAGKLLINGNNSAATGAVTVAFGATLGGTGTVGGVVSVAGAIDPGNPAAIGSLAVASTGITGTFACDIDAATSDTLAVVGNLNLTGSSLSFNQLAAPAAASYTLATYTGTLTGTFGSPTLPPGYSLDYGSGTNSSITLVLSASDYDTWAGSFSPPVGLPGADDDNDGLTNHEEYAFGLLPNDASSGSPITVPLDKATGTFTYSRRTQSLTGLAYTVWTSTDLDSWAPATVIENVTGPVADVETVQITLTPVPSDPALFIQVRAQ